MPMYCIQYVHIGEIVSYHNPLKEAYIEVDDVETASDIADAFDINVVWIGQVDSMPEKEKK